MARCQALDLTAMASVWMSAMAASVLSETLSGLSEQELQSSVLRADDKRGFI
uniref:Uncharacterized protein n=1 Tax=Sphingomonas sp. NS2 TaxID=908605 RepID=A0A0D4ZZH0_9SPHN|nr:hypothetical protein plasmid201_160 [Sphingomonas sp. NS2]